MPVASLVLGEREPEHAFLVLAHILPAQPHKIGPTLSGMERQRESQPGHAAKGMHLLVSLNLFQGPGMIPFGIRAQVLDLGLRI